MSKQFVLGLANSSSDVARGKIPSHPSIFSDVVSGWLQTLSFWIERSQQRKDLAELAESDDCLLKDIGVSREEALREAAKPFWR